jgi:hypothetical protein
MFEGINPFAVLVAAASAFLLGGLWYSKLLFLQPWLTDSGTSSQPGHPGKVFGLSFLFSLISAYVFAKWLGPDPPLGTAVLWGALAGAGLVAASFGINYTFAQRPTRMWLIDGGYHTLQFILYGLILGIWP